MCFEMPIMAIKQKPVPASPFQLAPANPLAGKAYTHMLVLFQSIVVMNICGVNKLPSVGLYVTR
jgi:hypothetical protein